MSNQEEQCQLIDQKIGMLQEIVMEYLTRITEHKDELPDIDYDFEDIICLSIIDYLTKLSTKLKDQFVFY